jgi:diacylglycerol kinase family enzyme
MVQFHDVYTYFGRVPLRLDADAPDPMSVLTIERLPIRRAGTILRRAMGGSLERVKGMYLDRRVESLTAEADDLVEVQMDGEHYGAVAMLSAQAHPDSLRIAVPLVGAN